MYNVEISTEKNKTLSKTLKVKWESEKLDQVLGRYLRKYGAPIELVTNHAEIREFEFYTKNSEGYTLITVVYALETSKVTDLPGKHINSTPPVVVEPPKALVDEPEFMAAYVKEGCFV